MAALYSGQIVNDQFLIIARLGNGAFGLTFHAFDLSQKRNVVIKILLNAQPDDSEKRDFMRRCPFRESLH